MSPEQIDPTQGALEGTPLLKANLSPVKFPEFDDLRKYLAAVEQAAADHAAAGRERELLDVRSNAVILRHRLESVLNLYEKDDQPKVITPIATGAPIDVSQILVIPKLSKLEWDMRSLKLTRDEIVEKYKTEGSNLDEILASHDAQKNSFAEIASLLPPDQFLARDSASELATRSWQLVVALGGDNHAVYVSHFVKDGLILKINSDPAKSEGALTSLTADNFQRTLDCLRTGKYTIEEWPRLEVTVNGQFFGLTTSELFLGEEKRKYMSRYVVSLNGQEETQKCSGLLISTGAGSTGWYDSSCRYLHPFGNPFPRTEQKAIFLATEPYHGRLNSGTMLEGTLKPGDVLTVRSLNDDAGEVDIDSIRSAPFKRGTRVEIRIADTPLRVVKILAE